MTLSTQDALIYLMVVTAWSDSTVTTEELRQLQQLVETAPVFAGYDVNQLPAAANLCADLINGSVGLEGVIDLAVKALPDRLQDTAYAFCVEIAVVDRHLEQEELRFLEMVRDALPLDRLVTAAIETAARARLRKA